MFDTLTDLVEHYKRKGIEEMSGNWVQFKQVTFFFLLFLKFHSNLVVKKSLKTHHLWKLGRRLSPEASSSGFGDFCQSSLSSSVRSFPLCCR